MNDNTSGHGPASVVPEDVKRWNWGAFWLSWIWGIGNNTWIALLSLIPFVNLVMPFLLGAKGNEWAWRNKPWTSVGAFHKTQKVWAIVGTCLVLTATVGTVAIVGGTFFAITSAVTGSEPYKLGLMQLEGSTEAAAALGNDIKPGWLTNSSFEETNGRGAMQIEMDVKGSKSTGKLFVSAKKENSSKWWLTKCELYVPDDNKRINLLENKI